MVINPTDASSIQMKNSPILSWLTRFEKWMWEVETSGKVKSSKFLWHSARILFAVVRDLLAGNITLYATALVFTTLLSIVPVIAFSFAILKSLGFHNKVEPILNNLLEPLGPQRQEIISKIISFVDNIDVRLLGFVLLAFLMYSVITLVQKIEQSFNSIWRVTNMRSFMQRFSNYLSVILIGPLVVILVLGATVDSLQRVISEDQFSWFYTLFDQITPFLMIIALSTFLFVFVPNTKVKVKYALTGGVVSGVLWQSISRIFSFYVANAKYEDIYPGFAVAILFLFWIYLIWLILLVGASVSFYAQHASQITKDRNTPSSASIDEHTGLSMVYRVAKQFDSGSGGVAVTDLESNLSVGPETIQRIIDKLCKHNILIFSGNGEDLLPAQSLDKILLKDLIRILRAAEVALPASLTNNTAVTEIIKKMEQQFDAVAADMTVAQWVRA